MEDWIHPAGDEEPDRWAPHHNFLIRGEVFRVDVENPGNPVERRELRYFLSPEQLDELREMVRSFLVGTFGFGTVKPNIWWNFVTASEEVGKRIHVARYTCRAFPRWDELPGRRERRYRLANKGWPAIKTICGIRSERKPMDTCWIEGCETSLCVQEVTTDEARDAFTDWGIRAAGITGPPEF